MRQIFERTGGVYPADGTEQSINAVLEHSWSATEPGVGWRLLRIASLRPFSSLSRSDEPGTLGDRPVS
jgi:hypothetical protein